MAVLLFWLLFFKSHACEDILKLFEQINENAKSFNAIGAEIAWQSAIEPNKTGLSEQMAIYQKNKIVWQHDTCDTLASMHDGFNFNKTQQRQWYLLCRGPTFYYNEARQISDLYEELQSIYSENEVCIPDIGDKSNDISDIESAILKFVLKAKECSNDGPNPIESTPEVPDINGSMSDGFLCFKGEKDFENLMRSSRNPVVLEWVWLAWREKVRTMREPYMKLVDLENKAAKRKGYRNIGDSWREELEMPHLRVISHQLYKSIKPLYVLLHGVVRFYLRKQYGDAVNEKGPIPAHLLGSLWSQNWEPLADLIFPEVINLDERIKNLNWTVEDMVKRTEDFYVSLGLPPMTETFWRESVYTRDSHEMSRCHGTAADMFKNGDFRLLYCADKTFEDFYVIHHEMGHIQYYMAYEKQPALFRQANSAFHESIGDTIMYGVMTPQHLQRLRLLNDSELFCTKGKNKDIIKNEKKNNTVSNIQESDNIKIKGGSSKLSTDKKMNITDNSNSNSNLGLNSVTTDDVLLLKQALNKLPQIPFALLMDEYRWKYFEGSLDKRLLNSEFWEMSRVLQGIAPPGLRCERYFDVGATFHVADNTPYIRYFFSSFLQHQLFEGLCKAAVLGHRKIKMPLPDTILLNRCDIYGSKTVGKILKNMMSRGTSQHWQQILQETVGQTDISAGSLKRYYRPLYKVLMRLVDKYNIPIGW